MPNFSSVVNLLGFAYQEIGIAMAPRIAMTDLMNHLLVEKLTANRDISNATTHSVSLRLVLTYSEIFFHCGASLWFVLKAPLNKVVFCVVTYPVQIAEIGITS